MIYKTGILLQRFPQNTILLHNNKSEALIRDYELVDHGRTEEHKTQADASAVPCSDHTICCSKQKHQIRIKFKTIWC
jgi:hypothetical protein